VLRRRWPLALAGLAAAAVGLLGLLAWRLVQAPIVLGVLVPRIEAALGAAVGSPVSVGGAALAWDGATRHLELRVEQVEVATSADEERAVVRSAALAVEPWELLRGRLVVAAVDVLEPRLRILWRESGGLELRSGSTDQLLPVLDSIFRRAAPGLRRVGIRHGAGEIALDDTTWRADDVDIELRRERAGIGVRGHLALEVGAERVPVRLDGRYRATAVRLAIGFRGLSPPAVAAALPRLKSVAALILPLGGVVDLRMDDELRLHGARLRLASPGGTLALVPGSPLPVGRTAVAAILDRDAGRLEIGRLAIDLAGAPAELRAALAGLEGAGSFEADGRLGRLPVARLASCWPEGLAPGARRVVLARVAGGELRDLQVRLAGRTLDGRLETVDGLAGGATFRQVALRPVGALPPLAGLAGTATFSQAALDLDVAGGTAGSLRVERTAVRVTGGSGAPRVAVDARLRGGVADALAALERISPLAGIELSRVRGEVEARVVADVPLGGPPPDLVALGLRVTASLHGLGVPRLVRGWSLTGGELSLALEGRRLALGGEANVEGVPVTLDLTETLGERGSRALVVRARLDRAGRAALGLDPGPLLDGPVDVTARVARAPDGADAVDVDADLRDARVELPPLGASKPAGAPGEAHARISARDGEVLGVPRLALSIPDATVTARATRSTDGATWSTVDADAVYTPPGRKPRSGHLGVTLRGRQLAIRSDDGGTLFRVLGKGSAAGGRLAIDGTIDLTQAGPPFDARIELHDCTVTNAPLLARVATLGSLGGIRQSLSGGGLRLERLTARLSQQGRMVRVADAAARGPALTAVVEGTVDREADAVDLRGTLVPAYYGINTAPARLPLIGGVVAGAGGGTLQAVDFRVHGRASDPVVSVEPLSVVTLPALRRLSAVLDRPAAPAPPDAPAQRGR